jgi:hypothetical protein
LAFFVELKPRNAIGMAGLYSSAFVGGPLGPKQHPLDIRRPQAASYGNLNEIFE